MKIVVIGAGVIGLFCGYALMRRGCSVTLLDKGQPGAACSSSNAGWVVPSLAGPLPAPGLARKSLTWMLSSRSPLYIKPAFRPDLVKWLWRFWRHCDARHYRTGLESVARLGEETMALYDAARADGVEFEMEHAGVLLVCLRKGSIDEVLADLEPMRRYGYRTPRVVSGPALLALEPALSPTAAGAVLVEEERHLRPEALTAGLVKRLTAMGAEIHPEVEVVGVRRRGRAITAVITAQGSLAADLFLLAAGAWSGRLAGKLGVRLPVEAGKGYSVTIRRPGVRIRRPLYLEEARIACTPFGDALRAAGTMELSGLNTTLDRRRIAAIDHAMDTYLPGWSQGEGRDEWVGMRPVTPDGLPMIGRVRAYDNLYVATGHAILGVTLAPATAAAISDVMCSGTTGIDLTAFDPGRFG